MSHRDDRSGKDPDDEAQAALDAVRRRIQVGYYGSDCLRDLRAILAALENLDARLKALEGERGKR